MVRVLEPTDVEKLKKIHDKFFSHEFSFPDFFKGFLCAFVIVDDTGNIITATGIRPIAEVITLTDKTKNVRSRREALYKTLEASAYMANQAGYDQLHCFIQDDTWEYHLLKHGWRATKGNSLVIDI